VCTSRGVFPEGEWLAEAKKKKTKGGSEGFVSLSTWRKMGWYEDAVEGFARGHLGDRGGPFVHQRGKSRFLHSLRIEYTLDPSC